MAMWRTDCIDSAAVTATRAASRARSLRFIAMSAISVMSKMPKGSTTQSWKSGECHSRMSVCCAPDPWVRNAYARMAGPLGLIMLTAVHARRT